MLVSGHVQGVGFRYFAERAANDLNVTGWAKNLVTGEVEILAQGHDLDVKAYIARICEGPSRAMVTSVSQEWIEDEPPHQGFSTR